METDGADKAPPPPAEPTKQLKVTYELYKKIANMLVHYLRGVEEATGGRQGEGREGDGYSPSTAQWPQAEVHRLLQERARPLASVAQCSSYACLTREIVVSQIPLIKTA